MASSFERTVACNRCGQPARQSFCETRGGWSESFHCPSCGQLYEADGRPPTPEEFRRIIIAQEGEWLLELTAAPSVVLLKAIRKQFSLSISETLEMKRRPPGELRRGTRYEMEKLLYALAPFAEPGVLLVRRAACS